MVAADDGKPLLEGGGLVRVDDFCRSTGLDRATVESLVRSHQLKGLVDAAGRVVGLVDDVLPTAEELAALGLAVRRGYHPDHHRSYEDDSGDPDEPDDSAWSWAAPLDADLTMTRLSSTQVYADPWLAVRVDEVRRRDGSAGSYSVVESPDVALVIPARDDQLLLVEQYRHPIASRSWEFPAGTADPELDANPWTLAARELREETGLSAGSLTLIGSLDVAPSTLSQRCWVFLATELTYGAPQRDPEEQDMESFWFTRSQVEQMIQDGTLTDAKTCAAYARLQLLRERP